MRMWAPQHFGMQHAGEAHIEGVPSRAGYFVGTVEPDDRRAEWRRAAVHQRAPALAAARTASMII